jgi:pyruvate/2-oxoglutarate dehydrogenase complex dihydrolipoamide dehydrogenase (E3) component
VEKHRIGGDCTWTGCVPSKALLKAAKVAHQMRTAGRFGLVPLKPEVDLKRVMDHVREVIAEIYEEESPEALHADGIDVFIGEGRFIDPHTLSVGEGTLTARNILLATGARPDTPSIQGLDDVDYLTYENVWELETLPEHLIVIGAGPVGSELSQAFRRFGSRVTLIEQEERILTHDEAEASRVLSDVFTAEGIDLRLSTVVRRVWQDDDGIHLDLGGDELVCDRLLVAVGRHPTVDGLDLKNAGVEYNAQGILVSDKLQTSQRHIYAAGDCVGGYQFTHYAGWQGFMAARNALLPGSSKGVLEQVPWTTFTDPEVAHVGFSEAQAREQFGSDVRTCHWSMNGVDRARTDRENDGFIKLVHKSSGELLGVTIVANHAGEVIHEWILALDQGLKVGDLTDSLHVYPTYSIAGMQTAAHIYVGKLLAGTSGRVIRGLARVMR